jgi:small subunit ribosomal protein S17
MTEDATSSDPVVDADTSTETETETAATAPVATPAAAPPAAAGEAAADVRPNRRKVREGIASSTKMDKTVVVKVTERVRHPRYGKTVQRSTKLHAHDETNDVREGDRVRIAETRPLSKLKRWRVVEVLERAR